MRRFKIVHSGEIIEVINDGNFTTCKGIRCEGVECTDCVFGGPTCLPSIDLQEFINDGLIEELNDKPVELELDKLLIMKKQIEDRMVNGLGKGLYLFHYRQHHPPSYTQIIASINYYNNLDDLTGGDIYCIHEKDPNNFDGIRCRKCGGWCCL